MGFLDYLITSYCFEESQLFFLPFILLTSLYSNHLLGILESLTNYFLVGLESSRRFKELLHAAF